MAKSNWVLMHPDKEQIIRLSRELNIFPLTAQLLLNRGMCDTRSAEAFLSKTDTNLYDPFLLPDMHQAVDCIEKALSAGKKITIYGDYDVDGVTSVYILYSYLKNRGGDVDYYIPSRTGEGYGMNREALDKIAQTHTDLIVTVDTGTTAIDEAAYIKECNMELVVTDHHECRDTLPDCRAVVNPRRNDSQYPYPALAGVGVAFKLICAMALRGTKDTVQKQMIVGEVLRDYCEFVCIGTVADVMPLTDENRLIVALGLAMLDQTENFGIQALIAQASLPKDGSNKYPPKKRKLTAAFISYTIAPRLNAAGRMCKADRAVELFLSADEKTADEIALELCEENRKRQETENEIINEAFDQIAQQVDLSQTHILVLDGDAWHHGVIGIVASRVAERYHLPTILISFAGDSPDIGKGSGRSIAGLNLVEALTSCSDILMQYGGHEMAAGLTVHRENLAALRQRLNAFAAERRDQMQTETTYMTDAELQIPDLLLPVAEEITALEPYGTGNPAPLFLSRNVLLRDISPVSNHKHTRLTLVQGERQITAMYFGVDPDTLPYRPGDRMDVLYQMDINDFMNRRSVQMLVRDTDFPAETLALFEREEAVYHTMQKGMPVSETQPVPERDDFRAVYRYLKENCSGKAHCCFAPFLLAGMLRLPLYRVLCCLDIFTEMGLICKKTLPDGQFEISVPVTENKVDLSASSEWKRLRERYT